MSVTEFPEPGRRPLRHPHRAVHRQPRLCLAVGGVRIRHPARVPTRTIDGETIVLQGGTLGKLAIPFSDCAAIRSAAGQPHVVGSRSAALEAGQPGRNRLGCQRSAMSGRLRPGRQPEMPALPRRPASAGARSLSRSFLPGQGACAPAGIWQLSGSTDRQDQPNRSVHAFRGIPS